MGIYLNSISAHMLFQEEASATYFVDKTEILKELIPLVEPGRDTAERAGASPGKGQRYVCITRPRRFGKTVMAEMIAAYFGKGTDSSAVFDGLRISGYAHYRDHLNKHNVIHIMLNELPDECTTYRQYITRIKKGLLRDLGVTYPDAGIEGEDAVWDAFKKVFGSYGGERFIFVLDEWDHIFHRSFITKEDQAAYLDFLRNLLKDQPYVEMAYMTGILPISKYSSGSELNMFFEFSMATKEKYSEYFGFTDEEVDSLYERYRKIEDDPKVTRDGLRLWYDGYQTMSGKRMYNPRSVVGALSFDQLGSYWTSSGPYDEIYTYVKEDIGDIKEDIGRLMSGIPVRANVQEYASVSMDLTTKDEVYSAMVVYGFLSYADGYVSIPNKELMDKFADMVRQKPTFGYA